MWVLFRFTRVSTLRMKWTRQRCQADPTITASTAALRPTCCEFPGIRVLQLERWRWLVLFIASKEPA